MINLTAEKFAEIVSGKLHQIPPQMQINQYPVIHSNKVGSDTFFVAFVGEKVDGHDFIDDAIAAGAKFALVSKPVDAPSIEVSDVAQALLCLAEYVRNAVTELKVIGITGSQGKTTTKEFLKTILSLVAETVATEDNFNTDIGVPLTLLRTTFDTKYCVIEMGARHVGDIAKLTRLAKPDVGVVLVVASAHVGEFGSVELIVKTKAELIQNLEHNKIAILGSYDSYTPKMADSLNLKKILFGQGQDVRAADIEIHGGFAHFDLVTPTGRNRVSLQVLGEHQIPNALAAAAVAFSLGVPDDVIAIGLTAAVLTSKWRMQIEEINEVQIIHDYYNANPESMAAAIRTLAFLSQERGGQSWAILGKMHELGSAEKSGHEQILTLCQEVGIDHLISVGCDLYRPQLDKTSLKHTLLHHCSDMDAVLALANNFNSADVLLLKASRSEKFENLAELICTHLRGVSK